MGDGLQRASQAARLSSHPVDVRVGQVWEDNDPRITGCRRQIKVLEIKVKNGAIKAVVQHPSGLGAKTRIRIDRFRPTSTGYRLVQDVPRQS